MFLFFAPCVRNSSNKILNLIDGNLTSIGCQITQPGSYFSKYKQSYRVNQIEIYTEIMANKRKKIKKTGKRDFRGNRYSDIPVKTARLHHVHAVDSSCSSSCSDNHISDLQLESTMSTNELNNCIEFETEGQSESGSESEDNVENLSSSFLKIKDSLEEILNVESNNTELYKDFGFIFLHSQILAEILKAVGVCPSCGTKSALTINSNPEERNGLAVCLKLSCEFCTWTVNKYSSPPAEAKINDNAEQTSARPNFDINIRSVIAFREIGCGFASLNKFCSVMDMYPPMHEERFDNVVKYLNPAYKKVARESCLAAAIDLRDGSDNV